MSKKKTNQKPVTSIEAQSPSTIIANALRAKKPSDTDFEVVTEQLLKFANSAHDALQPQVADLAERMSQLSELATADSRDSGSDHTFAASVRNFLNKHLTVILGIEGDDQAVADVMSEARANWQEYLEAFETFDDGHASDQDSWGDEFADPFDNSGIEASSNELETEEDYGSQIDLMLSAINGIENPSETPDVQPPAAEMFTENKSPASNSAAASDDSDAINLLQADHEMLEAYLDDASGCVASMEKSVLALESEPTQAEPVRQFCRELHTLKGASATVGLSGLATFLHNLETKLVSLFDGDQCQAEPDLLLNAVDTIRDRIESLSQPSSSPATDGETGAAVSSQTAETQITPARKVNLSDGGGDEASIRIRAAQLDRLMDMLAELVVLKNRREQHQTDFNRLNEELTRCSTRLRFASDASTSNTQSDNFVVAEIARDIAELGNELRSLQKPISADNQAISWFVRDFRQEIMQLRRMPVSGLFQRLQRAARDAAKVEDKQVQVQMVGAETGLEKELQESLYEPLIHIVRNAVSHGVERPDLRQKNGKSPVGTITLEARSSGQLLVIEVRDDGNGLDFDAVRKRARDKGLIPAHATPTESELAKLIFHPGFSTAATVSELSGRGVGMDVVAAAIEKMHGRIEITSDRGKGTTMRFTIPLRSGIEHVMVFRTAGQLFALPMQSVESTRKGTSRGKSRAHNLAEVLSMRSASQQTHDTIVMRASNRSLQKSAKTKERCEFIVDEIVGPEEVVVRSLPVFLSQHPLFCGVTLSGTSETVLLMDSERLQHFCTTHFEGDDASRHADTQPDSRAQRVLVVDDSLSARKHLVRKLSAAGYVILEAGDGLAALECLRKQSVDLIFTDLDMPQMGGLELLADLQRGPHSEIPVVVVSGRAEQDFQDRAAEAGATDFLVKPATDEQLLGVLEKLTAALAEV